MLKRTRLPSLLALAAALSTGAVMAAEPIRTTGEGALIIAAKLIEEDKLDEAEAILQTLAGGDPAKLDMRSIDTLAAKIAYKRGRPEEALRILEAMVVHDPSDWKRRFELVQLLIAEKNDRRARYHIRALLKEDVPEIVRTKSRSDLRMLDDRRVVRVSFRASAAPTTNVNSATRDESFDLFGFLPAQLDDEARQQSGLGVSYALSGALTPRLTEGVRAHIALRGQAADYGNVEFDQATLGTELGIRLTAENKTAGVIAATAERQYFGGNPYATSVGGRMALQRALSRRVSLSGEVAAKNVTYDDRADRDGPVFLVGTRASVAATKRLRMTAGLSAIREATQAESLANTQIAFSAGALMALPWRLKLGVRPEVTFRRFDKVAAIYAERREDITFDLTTNLSVRDLAVRGFSPSLTYRYTDNDSTVDLFSYDRHAVDVGFAKSF